MSAEPQPDAAQAVAPVAQKPIDAVALFKEVVLERTENLLAWLLMRLRRYRERRGNWWE